ncbi:pyridoxal-phosphate-dependent enzyme [Hyphomonas adhaerens MHS-3]|uniref:Pyridoxal-phosphate-dependent enzyme n=1 Tax=Hyphomonas adhaerens MHS-3 TaxID=1280949 RepID=A0A069E0I8_9PROT|nr:pyridoxal-phosphate dependent enzyme [Hyphomonas adhaerens]KCZ82880.1 pyridoxal-phosphate-dependent enzyme [Hyphomonas adhaerens MHS-3]
MPFTTVVASCPFKIGHTPLTAYQVRIGDLTHELLVKEERCNEFGSVKDRVAWYILSKTIEKIGPVKSVVDASSGNYGNALACICQRLGIGATIVSSASISAHNAAQIKGAGARLVIAEPKPGETSNAARMRVAGEIAEKDGSVFLDQYSNPLNPAAHQNWTAPELFAAGPFDAVFMTSSSGGTSRGFADYKKAHPGPTQLCLVEPESSCAFLDSPSGCTDKLKIPAFGSQRRSSFAGMKPDPGMIRMDEAATLAAFTLLHEHQLSKVGLSSVGVILGALDWLSRQDTPSRVACICADGDERYLDEIQSRYIPAVGQQAYEAARARLAPVIAGMRLVGPVQQTAKAAAQ